MPIKKRIISASSTESDATDIPLYFTSENSKGNFSFRGPFLATASRAALINALGRRKKVSCKATPFSKPPVAVQVKLDAEQVGVLQHGKKVHVDLRNRDCSCDCHSEVIPAAGAKSRELTKEREKNTPAPQQDAKFHIFERLDKHLATRTCPTSKQSLSSSRRSHPSVKLPKLQQQTCVFPVDKNYDEYPTQLSLAEATARVPQEPPIERRSRRLSLSKRQGPSNDDTDMLSYALSLLSSASSSSSSSSSAVSLPSSSEQNVGKNDEIGRSPVMRHVSGTAAATIGSSVAISEEDWRRAIIPPSDSNCSCCEYCRSRWSSFHLQRQETQNKIKIITAHIEDLMDQLKILN